MRIPPHSPSALTSIQTATGSAWSRDTTLSQSTCGSPCPVLVSFFEPDHEPNTLGASRLVARRLRSCRSACHVSPTQPPHFRAPLSAQLPMLATRMLSAECWARARRISVHVCPS
jgi:hypothetical protein